MKTRGFVAFLAWLTLGIVLSAQAEEAGLKTLEDSDAAAASEAADRADLLVITNEELAPAWSKFANWKTATSRPTVIVTIEDIEEQFEGTDIQAKIRECCLKHIETKNTRWVVLGGDSDGDGGIVPDRDTDHSECCLLYTSPSPRDRG